MAPLMRGEIESITVGTWNPQIVVVPAAAGVGHVRRISYYIR
jgi:hypothetical protein